MVCCCLPLSWTNNEYFKSRLSLIVRVNLILNRIVVVDSDWHFDNLCGSHLQSQSELYHVSWWYYTLVIDLGLVARSLVGANRWLRSIKMYRFPWYLTLVSTNHASSNPGQIGQLCRNVIGRLSVKPWCYWLWRLVISNWCVSIRLLSQLNSCLLLVKL